MVHEIKISIEWLEFGYHFSYNQRTHSMEPHLVREETAQLANNLIFRYVDRRDTDLWPENMLRDKNLYLSPIGPRKVFA